MAEQLQIEIDASLVEMVALTDSGDNQTFDSSDELWSGRSGYTPTIRPDGFINGNPVVPGAADTVTIPAQKCYLAGVETTVALSTDFSVPRPTLAYLTTAITVNSSGVLVAIAGAESAVGLSTVRGADGGPPLIPVGSIERCQVKASSAASGVYLASEIKQTMNTHHEMSNYPVYNIRKMRVTNRIISSAGVDFATALPAIHTGAVTKGVYAEWYTPDLVEVEDVENFTPAKVGHSTTSTKTFNRVIGSTTDSLGQASFSVVLKDGISDWIMGVQDEVLFFKFKQNRLSDYYSLTQGTLGVGPTYTAGEAVKAPCTISPLEKTVEVIG